MKTKLKIDTKIEFESELQYEIINIYADDTVDLKALQPEYEYLPNYYPIYYSIRLVNYKII